MVSFDSPEALLAEPALNDGEEELRQAEFDGVLHTVLWRKEGGVMFGAVDESDGEFQRSVAVPHVRAMMLDAMREGAHL